MNASNHDTQLTPVIPSGGRVLEIDFPSLHIGAAEYREGPTGCTVFYLPQRAEYTVDVRGGSPGVVLLGQWDSGGSFLDALCITGGSVYGLESVQGVSGEIFAKCGYSAHWQDLARVLGAVIYDFRPRANSIYPDKALGAAAFRAAKPGAFPLGRAGAGISATVGKAAACAEWELCGQGGAFRRIGETRIALFTVVNAVGAVVDRSGKVVRGHLVKQEGRRIKLHEDVQKCFESKPDADSGNTTISALITNKKLASSELRQLGRQVHSSMARGIQPFHTSKDGDVFFTLSTQEVEDGLTDVAFGTIASELAWDAVLSSFEN